MKKVGNILLLAHDTHLADMTLCKSLASSFRRFEKIGRFPNVLDNLREHNCKDGMMQKCYISVGNTNHCDSIKLIGASNEFKYRYI